MNIVCIGEMLIDFVCTDTNAGLVNGVNYVKKSGGAPANVAACIAKLGGNAQLVAAVGNDPFGEFLCKEVQGYGVDIEYIAKLPMSTTFAYVSLAESGEREFAFSRGADEALSLTSEDIEILTNQSIVHLGSATALLGGKLNTSYSALAQQAKRKGNIICFDPNYRIDLWQDQTQAFIDACDPYFQVADMVKVSDEELEIIAKTEDLAKGCGYFHERGVKLVLVTLGGDGCLVSHFVDGKLTQTSVPAYQITPIDTTGAGDSFIGAILYQMSNQAPLDKFYQNEIEGFVKFAGKVSSLVCGSIGAMSALPTLKEVEQGDFKT